MRILAYDQSLNHWAYSFWDTEKDPQLQHTKATQLALKDYSELETTREKRDSKFIDIYHNFDDTIAELKPDVVVSEQPWFGTNAQVFKTIVILNTFLLLLSWKHGIKYKEINIRKYRCFFKLTGKDEVKKYIQKSYPEQKIDKNLDISDALLLGKYIVENKGDFE